MRYISSESTDEEKSLSHIPGQRFRSVDFFMGLNMPRIPVPFLRLRRIIKKRTKIKYHEYTHKFLTFQESF